MLLRCLHAHDEQQRSTLHRQGTIHRVGTALLACASTYALYSILALSRLSLVFLNKEAVTGAGAVNITEHPAGMVRRDNVAKDNRMTAEAKHGRAGLR